MDYKIVVPRGVELIHKSITELTLSVKGMCEEGLRINSRRG